MQIDSSTSSILGQVREKQESLMEKLASGKRLTMRLTKHRHSKLLTVLLLKLKAIAKQSIMFMMAFP